MKSTRRHLAVFSVKLAYTILLSQEIQMSFVRLASILQVLCRRKDYFESCTYVPDHLPFLTTCQLAPKAGEHCTRLVTSPVLTCMKLRGCTYTNVHTNLNSVSLTTWKISVGGFQETVVGATHFTVMPGMFCPLPGNSLNYTSC